METEWPSARQAVNQLHLIWKAHQMNQVQWMNTGQPLNQKINAIQKINIWKKREKRAKGDVFCHLGETTNACQQP